MSKLTENGSAALSLDAAFAADLDNLADNFLGWTGTGIKPTVKGLKVSNAVVNNNAAASYDIGADVMAVKFTGTNVADLTVNFPAAAAAVDGEIRSVTSIAGVAAVTFASAGATFVGAPAALTAGVKVQFMYDAATAQWIID